MKILLAGGGTAGHINPGIAVAQYIETVRPGTETVYIGTKRGLESRLVPEAGYPFYTIDIRGFSRSFSPKAVVGNVRNVYRTFRSTGDAKKILRETAPDVVVGTGGYVSGPVLYAAAKMGYPTAVLEQNAYPGVTTKLLSKRVDRVMLAMPEAEKYLKFKNPPTVTGNPVRPSLFRYTGEEAKRALGVAGKTVVLSFGGSLGASPINAAVDELLRRGAGKEGVVFFHASGRKGYPEQRARLSDLPLDDPAGNIRLAEYFDNMDVLMPAADLVICRAGAITLSEICCLGKPSLLIPSPYVAENHQYHNALTLSSRGAAELLEEKDLSGETLCERVFSLLADPERLRAMADAALSLAIPDANRRIADVILSLVK